MDKRRTLESLLTYTNTGGLLLLYFYVYKSNASLKSQIEGIKTAQKNMLNVVKEMKANEAKIPQIINTLRGMSLKIDELDDVVESKLEKNEFEDFMDEFSTFVDQLKTSGIDTDVDFDQFQEKEFAPQKASKNKSKSNQKSSQKQQQKTRIKPIIKETPQRRVSFHDEDDVGDDDSNEFIDADNINNIINNAHSQSQNNRNNKPNRRNRG